MKVNRPGATEPEDPLPEGTETVVWVGGDDFSLHNTGEYDEEIFPDDVDLSPVESPHGWEKSPSIIYEPGDELPLPVARDQWKYHSGAMAAFDVDDRRLDERDHSRENSAALERWSGRRVHG